MKKYTKKRGILASAGALLAAAALALGGAGIASADTVDQMPEDSAVVITKLEQPSEVQGAADGLPNANLPSDATAIPNVKFEAYLVPVTDGETPAGDLVPGTNEWQQAVAAMTVADAQAAIGGDPEDVRSGTTDANGIIRWQTSHADKQGDSLLRGLYLIREVETPAGVVASGDFLLAVPLTDPTDLDAWLDTIYVYPKNRTLEGEKTVENAEDFVVGDTVTWTIDLDNPSVRDQTSGAFIPSDRFEILDTIADEYLTTTVAEVNVTVPGGLEKDADDDYTVALVPGTGEVPSEVPGAKPWQASDGNGILEGFTQIQVVFTEGGRAALAAEMNEEADPVQNVVITIDTVVNKVGVIENSAQFYSSSTQTTPAEVPGTDVRYGAISLEKTSNDDEVTDLSGAQFRVYLNEDAAKAADANNNWGGPYRAPGTNAPDDPGNLDGYLVPADGPFVTEGEDDDEEDVPTGIFITEEDGKVTIGGLRYSNWADGKSLTEGQDSEFQRYWLVETKALDGHQLLGEPVSFLITAQQASLAPIAIENQKDGGFQLPLTGGSGTLALTVAGLLLLGTVLYVARRRRSQA